MTANTAEDELKEESYLMLAMLMIVVSTEIGVEFSKKYIQDRITLCPKCTTLGYIVNEVLSQ